MINDDCGFTGNWKTRIDQLEKQVQGINMILTEHHRNIKILQVTLSPWKKFKKWLKKL